jgi:hypothetical protein
MQFLRYLTQVVEFSAGVFEDMWFDLYLFVTCICIIYGLEGLYTVYNGKFESNQPPFPLLQQIKRQCLHLLLLFLLL